MSASPPPIDPVTLVVAALSAVMGHQFADSMGPYLWICFCALLGGTMSATRYRQSSILGTAWSILLSVGIAIVISLPAAVFVAAKWPTLEVGWTLGMIAALVGGVGTDWPKVFKWLFVVAGDFIESKTKGRGKQR